MRHPAFRPAEKLSPLFVRLFFGYKGLLDVNSSSKDQPALCIPGLGGLFSMTLSLPYTDEMLDDLFQGEIQKGSRLGNTIKAINFTPGLFFSATDQSRSWDEVLNYCQNEFDTTYLPVYQSLNVTQKILRITMPAETSVPPGIGSVVGGGGGGWGGGGPQPGRFPPGTVVTLQAGDIILSVNGQAILQLAELLEHRQGLGHRDALHPPKRPRRKRLPSQDPAVRPLGRLAIRRPRRADVRPQRRPGPQRAPRLSRFPVRDRGIALECDDSSSLSVDTLLLLTDGLYP